MIRIEYDFTKTQEDLKAMLQDQTPFATSLAINRTLTKTRQWVKDSMDAHIEGGPTPFTRNGMRVYPTRKDKLFGGITFVALYGDRAKSREYMQELMYGGTKKAFRKKIPEPDIENLKKFAPNFFTDRGNIKRNFYKMAENKGNKKYFIGAPRRGKAHWPTDSMYGIWKRDKENGKLQIMVYLSRRTRTQRKTFPAPTIAETFFNNNISLEFRNAYAEALQGDRRLRN